MVALEDYSDQFEAANATFFGISADSSFSLGAFADEYEISFDLVSDMAGEAIEAFDLSIDIPELGLFGIANRAVYVLNEDGVVSYEWIAEDPTNEPDYDELLTAVRSLN